MILLQEEHIPHILIVDDEDEICKLLSHFLVKYGFCVTTALSAEAAFEQISAQDFDVIITDVMMPGQDGIQFLSAVHRQKPHVPVIIMTGSSRFQYAVDAVKHGAFDFITKPMDYSYLRSVVDKAVEYTRLRRLEQRYKIELEETVAQRTEELKCALAELDAARSSVLEAARAKSAFMSTVTHEMRTPMSGVIGMLDLLADTELNGSQASYLRMARESAENMMELVNRMLTYASGVGRGPFVCQYAFDLAAGLQHLIQRYQPLISCKGLACDVQIASELPGCISCDGEQLIRLLDCLLSNALKFTPQGFVKFEVASECLEGNTWQLQFCVSDSGIGIAPDMQEHIFEPFWQVDNSLARRYEGAGLGLSIARQIAQLMGGTITVESVPGEGSCFAFDMLVEMCQKETHT